MAKKTTTPSASTSTSTSTSPAIDTSRFVSHGELAEGTAFGPTSFRGYVLEASYAPHRILGKDQEEKILEKGLERDGQLSYFLSLRLKFRVLEVFEPQDGSFDREEWETHISLGKKSLNYLYATNDITSGSYPPAGDDEATMRLLAKGYLGDDTKPQIIKIKGPEGAETDLSSYNGRWIVSYPDTPESRRKLEPKSAYVQFMSLSAPAVEAVDSSLVNTLTDKKGNQTKIFAADSQAPDGMPWGAEIFKGLSGVWDTKKIPLGDDFKNDKGEPVFQRVLMITSYDGKVAENGTLQTPASQTTQQQAATAPAQTSVQPQAQAPSQAAPSNGAGDLDTKIKNLILQTLSVGENRPLVQVVKAVVVESGAFGPSEHMGAAMATQTLLKAAPKTADEAELAAMMGGVAVTFNPETQVVTRVA